MGGIKPRGMADRDGLLAAIESKPKMGGGLLAAIAGARFVV
jgi:hypothetical protein